MSNKTTIEIDGKNKGAIVSINGVKSELKGLAGYIGGPFGASINTLQKHLGLAALGGAIGGLAALTKQAINSADEIYNMSQRVGVSVESLSTLKYAADLSNLSLEKMEGGLKKLSVNLYDVAHGQGKDAAIAFNELGIEALDTNGKVKLTENVLLDVAQKFSLMEDGTNKSALAVKLFGKAGMEMIPFLNQGKDGIESLTNEAKKLGLEMSTEFASNAEAFNDNLTTMGYVLQGIGLSIAQELMPVLFSLSGAIKTYTTETETASTAGAGFADVLKGIITGLGAIYAGATMAGDALGTFYATVATFFSTFSFEQTANVVGMGFDKIEKDALDFGKAFDALWTDNTASYKNYIDSISGKDSQVINSTKALKDLYDAFGHPLDKDGNLANNIKYIENLFKSQTMGGFEEMFTNIPSFNIAETLVPEFDPFANARFQAVDFFDMYDERAALMRDNTASMFGNMDAAASMFYQASGQKAKAWFEVQKAFNIAQALMNTYEGATKALAQGGFFGIAMAATVIAAGLAQVAMIASQRPSSSSSGSRSSGSSVSPVGNRVASSNPSSSGSPIVNITIQGSYWDEDRIARDLVPALTKAYGDSLGNR